MKGLNTDLERENKTEILHRYNFDKIKSVDCCIFPILLLASLKEEVFFCFFLKKKFLKVLEVLELILELLEV